MRPSRARAAAGDGRPAGHRAARRGHRPPARSIPPTIVAIVGKTEGNGCVNDFTRGYATLA